MRKLFTLLLAVLLSATVWAQSPDKMSYQAVIRDASDNLMTEIQIGMQISILQGSIIGTAVYVETHTPTTNANGLVSIEVGIGTVLNGDFATIDWANGPYFIKTETDPTGGTSYTITGTSQLLSVPYALHAKTAESLAGGITETDPVFNSWDKDYSDLINTPTIPTVPENVSEFINDAGYLTSEIDPSVPTGTQIGQMQYWNGTEWVTVQAGNSGEILLFINGKPTWGIQGMEDGDCYNPTTGQIWMDRNLGALQVATSSTDHLAYGDLYQWGRGSDGHQTIVWTSSTASNGAEQENETTTLSNSDTPGHGDFITNGSSLPYDWRSPQNDNLWQGVSGTNNPCPSGYRLPTEAELDAERQSWSSNNAAGAFASPLKLPVAGYRNFSNGSLSNLGSRGFYWSSTVDGTNSQHLFFYSSNAGISSGSRAYGGSVRCLKD
jgi:uncharacterized protein (TIGR02145 family)